MNLGVAQLPRLRARRARVEPARRAVRGHGPRAGWPSGYPRTTHLAPDGRVMEILSEHTCQGWLEGYLLTGPARLLHDLRGLRPHRRLDVQPAREVAEGDASEIPWRRPIASLNYLLTSHVWRQDHNGFSHQDPGFIDHVVNKKAEVIRVYLPPDANTLLSRRRPLPARAATTSTSIIAGKQPQLQYLDMDAAIKHCTAGIGIWEWASNDRGSEPDVVMACCGDVPTMETLAAVELLRELLPRAQGPRGQRRRPDAAPAGRREHPHGLTDTEFDAHLHDRQADHLRLPRLSLADPPADVPPHEPRQPPRPRLQGGRARRRRRSTWSSATTSTASTSSRT